MVLVYLATKLGDFLGKCWDSYSSTMEHLGMKWSGEGDSRREDRGIGEGKRDGSVEKVDWSWR